MEKNPENSVRFSFSLRIVGNDISSKNNKTLDFKFFQQKLASAVIWHNLSKFEKSGLYRVVEISGTYFSPQKNTNTIEYPKSQ